MKTLPILALVGSASVLLTLTACDPPPPSPTAAARPDDESRWQLEESRRRYEEQAAEMEARSARLEQEVEELKRALGDRENAELQARLDAVAKENAALQAEAEEAWRRSEELSDQLAEAEAVSYNPVPESDEAWMDADADYAVFYEELEPHGKWMEVEGYGYAWRPTVAERTSWRPYQDGRWAWSDEGWAWDSNEPFGWACYHYGRWVRLANHGWVWVPGREWAPAWVSWRSGDDHVGWAPLPPPPVAGGATVIGYDADVYYHLSPSSYVFIEAQNFARPSYVNVTVSITHVTQVFQTTVNVTNLVQVRRHDRRYFAHRGGPNRDWLERRCGARVPRAEVEMLEHFDRERFSRRRGRSGDDRVHLAALRLPTVREQGRREPPKVVERIKKPAIVDPWAEMPKERRDMLREMVQRQTRAPRLPQSVSDVPKARTGRGPVDVAAPTRPGVPKAAPSGADKSDEAKGDGKSQGRRPNLPGRGRDGPSKGEPVLGGTRPGAGAEGRMNRDTDRGGDGKDGRKSDQGRIVGDNALAPSKGGQPVVEGTKGADPAKPETVPGVEADRAAPERKLTPMQQRLERARQLQPGRVQQKPPEDERKSREDGKGNAAAGAPAAESDAQPAEPPANGVARQMQERLRVQRGTGGEQPKAGAPQAEPTEAPVPAPNAKPAMKGAPAQPEVQREPDTTKGMARQIRERMEQQRRGSLPSQRGQPPQEDALQRQQEKLKEQQDAARAGSGGQAAVESGAATMPSAHPSPAENLQRGQESPQRGQVNEQGRAADALRTRMQAVQRAQQETAQRAQQEAMRVQQDAERKAQQEAAQRAQQEAIRAQREAEQKAQQETAQRAQQEAMRVQREAEQRAQQEAARRAQQEAIRAQREAEQKAQQEAARRAQQEAMRAQREAAQKAQREAAQKAQQEAAQRAQQEAMRVQREAVQKAQQEAAQRAQQEAMRVQREAEQRAQQDAARQTEEPGRRTAAEEAARKSRGR